MAIILSKEERAVMQSVYELAKGKSSVLVTMEQIMEHIPQAKTFSVLYKRKKKGEAQAELEEERQSSLEVEQTIEPEEELPATRKRRRFGRHREQDDVEESVVEPKVYIDEAPVQKGMFIYEKPVKYAELPHVLDILDMEEYFELTEAVDGGEIKYIIHLLNRGNRWERDELDRKRGVILKLAMATVTPVLTFLLGIILRTMFGN